MVKIIIQIDGMSCGMCEAHVNDIIRTKFKIKKVSSSHSKGITEIISENEISENELNVAFDNSGYKLLSVNTKPYEKRKFCLFGK